MMYEALTLSWENETFTNFAFYSGLLLGKTVLMGPATTVARISNKVYANPEDTRCFSPGTPVNLTHPLVERIRRCHRNDLENVVPFTLIGLLYVSANPHPGYALNIFRVFAASRFLHTVAYLAPLPQPTRFLAFTVGLGSMAAMGLFIYARLTFMK